MIFLNALSRHIRIDFSNGPGSHMGSDFFQRAGPVREERDFSYGPGRHVIGDFSNKPGRAGKKRNELFNGRVWLQKKKEE